jgi:hypothetical protein
MHPSAKSQKGAIGYLLPQQYINHKHKISDCMLYQKNRYFLSSLLTMLAFIGGYASYAQQPAFPGAEGAGMYTTGEPLPYPLQFLKLLICSMTGYRAACGMH